MNVLFYTHYATMYGANKALVSLILDLRERYNVNPIVVSRKRGELDKVLKDYKIKHYKIGWIPWEINIDKYNFLTANLIYIFNRVFFLLPQIFVAKRTKADIIHVNSGVTDVGAEVCKYIKKPFIWHLREFGFSDYNLKYIKNDEYIDSVYSTANRLIAISESIRQFYLKRNINRDIVRIYDGVDCSRFVPTLKTIDPDEPLKICMVGVLAPGKNQLELLKALKILHTKGNYNIEVYLYGDCPDNYDRVLLEYASQNSIENVYLMGFCKDIPHNIIQMHIGIMCSRSEGFGLATVEYMLAGMAVITSSTGAGSELIYDGINGYTYSLGNAEQLSDIIDKLYKNRSLIRIVGEKARLDAIEKYSLSQNTDAIYHTYTEVINEFK